jgi:putative sugar O-methyltransferase
MTPFHQRIIEIYKHAQRRFLDHPNEKSEYWREYYNSVERFSDPERLRSFRSRNSLSTSLDDAYVGENFPFRVFAGLLEEIGEDYVMRRLPEDNIGRSDASWRIGGRYVDYNTLFHIRWLKDLDDFVFANSGVSSACEIGGGYGSLARLLLRHSPVEKFISLDLPEANLLTSHYLSNALAPETRFYLNDDYERDGGEMLRKEQFEAHDVFILPPWAVLDPEIRLDLFINARSMMEMRMEVITKYFGMIHRSLKTGGHFLNINRYHKQWADSVIRIGDYPYDDAWEVVTSKKSYLQPHIHFLLAQRLEAGACGNIRSELASLREAAKSHSPRVSPAAAVLRKALGTVPGKALLNRIGRFLSTV